MPINAGYEYFEAEKKYLEAKTLEEKIETLEELIKAAPKHKSSENLLSELKTRLKKFKEKLEKGKSVGKTTQKGIKKEGFQCVLVGLTNSGKSSILAKITNAQPAISSTMFTTREPIVGTMDYEGVKAQIVDLPSVDGRNFDYNVANSADCLLIVVNSFKEIAEVEKYIIKARGKRIVVFSKSDLLSKDDFRKIEANLKSKKYNFVIVSSENGDGFLELKEKIFSLMHVIRVYTKEPGKIKQERPFVLQEGSTVQYLAEKIYTGFSKRIKETRLTGPSGKFSNQKVGLKHVLKDKDIVEFYAN